MYKKFTTVIKNIYVYVYYFLTRTSTSMNHTHDQCISTTVRAHNTVNIHVHEILIQRIGNTDKSLIERGYKCITEVNKCSDDSCETFYVVIDDISLYDEDHVDVTSTHEEVFVA